jgi:hypothetical protein
MIAAFTPEARPVSLAQFRALANVSVVSWESVKSLNITFEENKK